MLSAPTETEQLHKDIFFLFFSFFSSPQTIPFVCFFSDRFSAFVFTVHARNTQDITVTHTV